jgi:hypothetical protein
MKVDWVEDKLSFMTPTAELMENITAIFTQEREQMTGKVENLTEVMKNRFKQLYRE